MNETTVFERTVRNIFERGAEELLGEVELLDVIERVKAGCNEATVKLLLAHAPALRNSARRLGFDKLNASDLIEARNVAAYALVNAASKGKPVVEEINEEVEEFFADALGMVKIPPRTLWRYFSILKRAEDDVELALASCGSEAHMSREVFLAVHAAISKESLFDPATSEEVVLVGADDASLTDVEDRIMAEIALAAMSDPSRDVCRLVHGFVDGNPRSLSEASVELGLGKTTVFDRHASGLAAGRKALGLG